jgi:hypothetical protein
MSTRKVDDTKVTRSGGPPVNRNHVIAALAALSFASAATVVGKLVSDGATTTEANEAVNHARSGRAREAEPGQPDVAVHRLALFTTTLGATQGNLRVRDALCADLAEAGPSFAPELAQCRIREAGNLSASRICNNAEAPRGFYAEGTFNERTRLRLVAQENLGPPNIILDVGTPAEVKAAILALGFKPCAEVP